MIRLQYHGTQMETRTSLINMKGLFCCFFFILLTLFCLLLQKRQKKNPNQHSVLHNKINIDLLRYLSSVLEIYIPVEQLLDFFKDTTFSAHDTHSSLIFDTHSLKFDTHSSQDCTKPNTHNTIPLLRCTSVIYFTVYDLYCLYCSFYAVYIVNCRFKVVFFKFTLVIAV